MKERVPNKPSRFIPIPYPAEDTRISSNDEWLVPYTNEDAPVLQSVPENFATSENTFTPQERDRLIKNLARDLNHFFETPTNPYEYKPVQYDDLVRQHRELTRKK